MRRVVASAVRAQRVTDGDSNGQPGNCVVEPAVDGCSARGLADNRRIERQRITRPGQLGLGYTPDDGLGLWQPHEYHVRDCIIDLSALPLEKLDEAVGVTWGASAIFRRCVIRGAGKLVLCGSGGADKAAVEEGRRVFFEDCILEQGSRRFPEVQCGMRVTLKRCRIRNWGAPDRFNPDPKTPDRTFAAWAHTPGSRIAAVECVFWQDAFWRPARQMWRDFSRHLGQAWADEGWRGLFRPGAWLPGVCRGHSPFYATPVDSSGCPGIWKLGSPLAALRMLCVEPEKHC